ncbi:hypothetical protein PMAYCL1PPCAC_09502, partial [Pristionchus mayeri]
SNHLKRHQNSHLLRMTLAEIQSAVTYADRRLVRDSYSIAIRRNMQKGMRWNCHSNVKSATKDSRLNRRWRT